MGKMTKSPFARKGERTSDLLGLIHTDVCGPMSTEVRGGFGYFITFKFTDDLSRYGNVYLMKHKPESFENFKEFQNEVRNKLTKTNKALRSNCGGECFLPTLHFIHFFISKNQFAVNNQLSNWIASI